MEGKERLNTWSVKDYIKNIAMILIKLPIWIVQLLLFWLPLKKNRIILYSLKQHGYSCNLKYLTEYLKKSGDYELLWIVKTDEDLHLLQNRGIPAAKSLSFKHFCFRMSAKTVITNDEFYPMFRKRLKQRYVNTWHGGINYKKIGYSGLSFTNPIQKLIYRMNNPCPDCFVSGSRSFTETASASFRFPKEVFLECGLPRNDVLCAKPDAEKIRSIRQALGITADQKILLYAPTFRKGGFGPQSNLDFQALCHCLRAKFGGEWVILLRQHYFVSGDLQDDNSCVIDVSRYEDMQELLQCAECMLSDYSSCMWDFLLTGKPCFVYAPDLEDYCGSDRSFFIPTEQWPYPISTTPGELFDNIAAFDAAQFKIRAEAHRKEFGSFDTGRACQQLAQYLQK